MNFEYGLTNLDRILKQSGIETDSELYLDFINWSRQLRDSIENERRYAILSPQESERRERILRELDRLALRHVSKGFFDLCASKPQQYAPSAIGLPTERVREFQAAAHALLIGVGAYNHPDMPGLPATVQDVKALSTILISPSFCGYLQTNVHLLTDDKATATNIRAGLRELAQTATPDATVFIYFSGHGGQTQENGKWQSYLCPREANPYDLASTAISGDEFSDLLTDITARKLLVILDACHAGGTAELRAADIDAVWRAGLHDSYLQALAQGSGRVVIASSKAGQFSWNQTGNEHGLFTWHLMEGMKGAAAVHSDGFVRVLDLYYYVSRQVKNEQRDQEPILQAKDLDDNFCIALALSS